MTDTGSNCGEPVKDPDYDPWDPWPSTAEQVAMTLAVPSGMNSVCSCGVPNGESEASNPDDRTQMLPHHFDCTAVTAWAVASHVYGQRTRSGIK